MGAEARIAPTRKGTTRKTEPAPRTGPARRVSGLWLVGLALAFALLAVDSARRLDGIRGATEALVGAGLRPEIDAGSSSGYRWNEHRLVLPQTDGYEWLLEAEQELNGGGARVRAVAFDDAPSGREVHWAGFLRWWGIGVARVYRSLHPELTAPQALERVAPWANTALLVVLLLALTPVLAARFGSLAASLFALGSVTIYPLYDAFGVGTFDHHGVAALLCATTVLCLVAGGGGWVRSDAPLAWLPTRAAARRWFVASGALGAAGLWISAAAMAPVLIGIGLGAVVACGVVARARTARAPWSVEPALFRTWGVAGGIGSLAFYLLEYFPAHLGLRLEVNHPLYALAFAAGGDLIARSAAALAAEPRDPVDAPGSSRVPASLGWIALDAALVLLLPAVILSTGASTFRIADPALWTFHDRYISEFLSLRGWGRTLTPAQAIGQMSLVPLAALPIAAALWPTPLAGAWRSAWRALLLVGVAAAALFLGVFVFTVTGGNAAVALVGAAGGAALWFVLPLLHRAEALPPPLQAALALAAGPALLLLAMALVQMRWLSIAAALWLGALVVGTFALVAAGHPLARTASGRGLSVGLALAVVALAPAFTLRAPFVRPNADVITRDASLWLRRRIGAEPTVVLASPTASTLMIWFGGFRGVGTLYWENLEGLRASNEIYSATDPDSARALLERRGVRHLAFFGWDGGLEQLEFSSAPDSLGMRRGFLHGIERALREGQPVSLPSWLVPLPYVPPTVNGYHHPIVELLEVVPDQPPEIAEARLAWFYRAVEDQAGMERALARALELGPSVPALALKAQLDRVRGDETALRASVAQLLGELTRADARPLELGDRVDAAIAFGLAGDRAEVIRQIGAALADVDEPRARRLTQDRLSLLVDLAGRLGLESSHPDALALLKRLSSDG